MTRYVRAFSWTKSIAAFLRDTVTERPLLNVCSGRMDFGDVKVDLYEPADVKSSWTILPFGDDTFGAVFADPPWNGGYKAEVALFMREALRVAPVAYLMAPWIWASHGVSRTYWVRELPGVNNAIILSRYERPGRDVLNQTYKPRNDGEVGAATGRTKKMYGVEGWG